MWRWLLLLFVSQLAAATFEARRSVLEDLRQYEFSKLLCGAEPLETCAPYRFLLQTIEADLIERKQYADKAFPDQGSEVFDLKLLTSPNARIVLTGVVPRFDRLSMLKDSCGEVRLTYRLALRYNDGGERFSSFLPATFLWVFELKKTHPCSSQMRSWNASDLKNSLRSLVVEGQRLELNLFALHRAAPLAPRSAGYSEYLMRVFRFDPRAKSLLVMPLENTPDLDRLNQNPPLKAELFKFLGEPKNQIAADESRLVLPGKFLATRALSISPFGALRLANAPFSQLLAANPPNPERLRRLNALSCQGCHQTASLAGFHFFGASLSDSAAFNRTFLPASPHFFAEQNWRKSFVSTYLASQTELPRPVPGRTHEAPGSAGDFCADRTLPNYGCQSQHSCRLPWDQPAEHFALQVGYCQKEKAPLPGEPCLLGEWDEASVSQAGLRKLSTTNCFGKALCLPQEIGFPGGLCVRDCENLQPGTACAKVPRLQAFADCRASGSLKECFQKHSDETQTRACDVDSPCRPDYSCAGRADLGEGEGVCVPPYFLPQLNISGHQL